MLQQAVVFALGATTVVDALAAIPSSAVYTSFGGVANNDSAVEAVGDRYVLDPIHTFNVAASDEDGAEYFKFDKINKRMYVVNSADNALGVFGLSALGEVTFLENIDLSSFGSPQSVAYNEADNVVAVAVDTYTDDVPSRGLALFYNASSFELITSKVVGYLPDHISFGVTGNCAYTADEGEGRYKDDTYTDPAGSITEICATDFGVNSTYDDVTSFNLATDLPASVLDAADLHFSFSPKSLAGLEPEYITYVDDGNGNSRLFVSLQEAGAVLILEKKPATVGFSSAKVQPMGFKSYGDNAFDLSPDDTTQVKTVPDVFGMFQMDTVKSFAVGADTFILFANEGDSKDYDDDKTEEVRVEDLKDDNVLDAKFDEYFDFIQRLKVTTGRGMDSGNYTELYSYGARSWSILKVNKDEDPEFIFDSGVDINRMMAKYALPLYNANDGKSSKFDSRSDDKGAEPESVAVGVTGGKTLAFIGLERPGLVAVYDVSDPTAPVFHSLNTEVKCEDLATGSSKIADPEAMTFVPAADSPLSKDILIVTGAVSNTITVFEVKTSSTYGPVFDSCPASETSAPSVQSTGNPTAGPTSAATRSAQGLSVVVMGALIACTLSSAWLP